jgi:hypothetical protein
MSSSTASFKLELAIPDLSALLISSSCVYISASKDQRHLHRLILHRLEWSANVNAQLTQLLHTILVYESHSLLIRTVEDNAHDCLSCSHWTVGFHMHLVNTHCITLAYKGVKDIFTEVFSFNDNFLLICMLIRVIRSQSIDTISLLTDPASDAPWIQSEHTGTSDHTDLRSPWDKDLDAPMLKLILNARLEVVTF